MPRPKKGEAKPARVVTKSDVCKMLDAAPNTVKGWIDEGDHDWIVQRPSGPGTDYRLDMPLLVKWLRAKWVAEAVAKVEKRHGPTLPDGDEDALALLLKDPEKRIKIGQAQVKFHKERQEVAMVADSKALWQRAFGVIRQSNMALGDRIIRLFPGMDETETREKYRQIQSLCADSLVEANKVIKDGQRGA